MGYRSYCSDPDVDLDRADSFIAVYQREEYVEDREIKNGMIGCIPALIGVLDMILGKIGEVSRLGATSLSDPFRPRHIVYVHP